MATKTFEELKQMAIQIRDEKTNKQNTATRIGTQMLEHLNKLEQDFFDKDTTEGKFSELEDNSNMRSMKSFGVINVYNGRCYDIYGSLIYYSKSWSATPLINIDDIHSDIVDISDIPTGHESAKISAVVYYDINKEFIRQSFSCEKKFKKSMLDDNIKYIAFSFYEKNDVRINYLDFESNITNLYSLHNENNKLIQENKNELGFIGNYKSLLTISDKTQYLCTDISIDYDVIYFKVTTDALINGGLYYNIRYQDDTYAGQKLIKTNDLITHDSQGKKIKDISVFVVANAVEKGGSANVQILADGLTKDMIDVKNEIINHKVEYWESDNLWDDKRLFQGYLWSSSTTGEPTDNKNWRMTDYIIPVQHGDKISVWRKGKDDSVSTNYISMYIAEYDNEGRFIKRPSDVRGTIYTVPNDVYGIKISIFIDHAGGDWNLYSYAISRYHYFVDDINPPYGVYKIRKGTKCKNKTIVYFGDSQIGFGNVERYLANLVGAKKAYNVGFGGCRMTAYGDTPDWDCFSMYRLAEAIAKKDFSYQEEGIKLMGESYNATHRLSYETLKKIDFDKVDIIIIHYGTNDWTGGATDIGNGDLENKRDFKGMISYIIKTILTAYPQIRLCFDSLTYREVPVDGVITGDDIFTAVNKKGNTIIDYNNAIKEVCSKELIQYNDLFSDFLNKYNVGYFTKDGVHLTDKGNFFAATKVANYL